MELFLGEDARPNGRGIRSEQSSGRGEETEGETPQKTSKDRRRKTGARAYFEWQVTFVSRLVY